MSIDVFENMEAEISFRIGLGVISEELADDRELSIKSST